MAKEKKEKISFFLSNRQGELEDMQRCFGCTEDIEFLFKIEFAGGIENDVPLFHTDVQWTEKEDEYLSKYDGMMIEYIFRLPDGKVIDTRKTPCRFDVMYDEYYRYNGTDQFSNPKVITRGV